jgi:hypothetical protein
MKNKKKNQELESEKEKVFSWIYDLLFNEKREGKKVERKNM